MGKLTSGKSDKVYPVGKMSLRVGDRFENQLGAIYLLTRVIEDPEPGFTTFVFENEAPHIDSKMALPQIDLEVLLPKWKPQDRIDVAIYRNVLTNMHNLLHDAYLLTSCNNGIAPDPKRAAQIIDDVCNLIDQQLYPED